MSDYNSLNYSNENIIELTNIEQWKKAFPVMKQLRTDLTEKTYLDLLHEMRKEGYQLFALSIHNQMVSLAGICLRTNFYNRRHVYIYDLVTDSSHRSYGYGERLLSYIQNWALENGAKYVALESGLQRIDAHRFYEEKLEYDKWCYSFRKNLIE